MWNLPAPPGFIGFDERLPVRYYQRHLPHWRQEGVTYFVTFRLADSLPAEKRQELARLREEWHRKSIRSRANLGLVAPSSRPLTNVAATSHPTFALEKPFAREIMLRVEEWLDQGAGACLLRESWVAQEVQDCLQHQHGKHFELCAYVIMPNHVHVLARPFSDEHFPLEKLVQGWKTFSALAINRRRGIRQRIWQDESFDRIIRDEEHLWRALQYIGSNPHRAGLPLELCRRYVCESYRLAGWDFVEPPSK
jgi:putative transposase